MKLFSKARKLSTPAKRAGPSRLQIIAAVLGSLVIVFCIVVLVSESLLGSRSAELSARILEVRPYADDRQVLVEVNNEGARTASQVMVSAAASGQGSDVTVDYVPAHGVRQAVLTVGSDGPVAVKVDSWIYP